MEELYTEIAETGTQRGMIDRLVTWEGRNEITGLDGMTDLGRRYSSD